MLKILIFIFSISLFANEYHLEDIATKFKIKKNVLIKLQKNNIKTTIQFLLVNKNSKMRAKNSRLYNISLDKLRKLTSLFALMRIKGIGPDTALLMFKANIKSLRRLNNANLKKLAKELIKINKNYHITPITPNYKNLLGWQKQVKKLNIILQ